MKNSLYNQALSYLEDGFSVIPVGKDKTPLIKWKAYQERLCTKKELSEWFKKHAVSAIGIVTGKISGIAVVDVEKGGSIKGLPETVMAKTGGDGWHYFYRYDEKMPVKNATRIRELTDIRGDGGYIIVPPSLHKSGKKYEWVVKMDRSKLVDFPYDIIQSKGSSQCSQSPEIVEEGNRNEAAASIAGKIFYNTDKSLWESEGWQEIVLWNQAMCAPPLEEKELRKVWDSIKKYHQGDKTRFKSKSKSKKKSDEEEEEYCEIYSKCLGDGRMVETYYDPEKNVTGFLLYKDGSISKVPELDVEGELFRPPPEKNKLISGEYVKLPSNFTEPISEKELLKDIREFIHEYVEVSEEFENIASFFTLFGWVYDQFNEVPYLRVIGDYGSGKSRMLRVMAAIGYKSMSLTGASSESAMFRMIDSVRGWLIFDEADLRYSDTKNEKIKILNSGFQEGFPVFRSDQSIDPKKAFDPTPFSVFCPKVISTRGKFNDRALESRCLTHAMKSLTRDDILENLDDDFKKKARLLRNKLVTYRMYKIAEGIQREKLPNIKIEPRLKQIITPIYSILSSNQGRAEILKFLLKKQTHLYEDRFCSFEGELLRALVAILEENLTPTMQNIADKHTAMFCPKNAISAKKVGGIVENIFHLKKRKKTAGYYLLDSQENEKTIEQLKDKFGLNQPNVDVVNNMNIGGEDEANEDNAKDI